MISENAIDNANTTNINQLDTSNVSSDAINNTTDCHNINNTIETDHILATVVHEKETLNASLETMASELNKSEEEKRRLEIEKNQLEIQLEEEKKTIQCAVCWVSPKSVLLIPCAHMLCVPCSEKVQRCPICRSDIDRRQATYG